MDEIVVKFTREMAVAARQALQDTVCSLAGDRDGRGDEWDQAIDAEIEKVADARDAIDRAIGDGWTPN